MVGTGGRLEELPRAMDQRGVRPVLRGDVRGAREKGRGLPAGDRPDGTLDAWALRSGSGLSFFFSSRRRHTRFDCDWSSDVCSSDLCRISARMIQAQGGSAVGIKCDVTQVDEIRHLVAATLARFGRIDVLVNNAGIEIGRASCRERV